MKIAIIKYNAGNIKSVSNALQRLDVGHTIIADHEEIKSADKVIFPGVGEASTTMKHLIDKKLDILIKDLKQPVLGICLGMQLMCRYSEEGKTPCLGIFDQDVKLFHPETAGVENVFKVPHIGWNSIYKLKNGIFTGKMEGQYVYFVHSYYVEKGAYTAAVTNYIVPFSAALQKDNFYAVQFHPEKSGAVGEKILREFVWRG